MCKTFRAAVLLSLLAASGLALAQEITIPFPRSGSAMVGLRHGPILIRSVSLSNRPDRRDVRLARRDGDDTTTLWWVFHVANTARRDYQSRIHVQVLSSDGQLLARDSREGEVDGRDRRDRITVWTKIRTRDYPRAALVKLTVANRPD